jgi:hypothetical protein
MYDLTFIYFQPMDQHIYNWLIRVLIATLLSTIERI